MLPSIWISLEWIYDLVSHPLLGAPECPAQSIPAPGKVCTHAPFSEEGGQFGSHQQGILPIPNETGLLL